MRAALYARYSTDNQSTASVEDQLRLCRQLAGRLGAQVAREFVDEGISGFTAERRGLAELLAFVRGGGCDLVIAEHSDRLARDGETSWQVFNLLRALGVRYVTVQEGEVTVLHQGVSSLVSELKGEEARQRTHRGLVGVVKSGRSAGGLPYGYRAVIRHDAKGDRIRGLREIDPREAAVVRRIFENFADGVSTQAIAHQLNVEGVPGPRTRHWRNSTLWGNPATGGGILRNELYRGVRVWGRNQVVKDRATGRRRTLPGQSAGEVVRETVEDLRIVSDELWARVQARFAAQAVGPAGENRGKRRPKVLFGGLIRCGLCGGGMTRGGSGDHMRCGNRAESGPTACENTRTPSYGQIERRVLDAIRSQLLHPDVVAAQVATMQKAWAAEQRVMRAAMAEQRKELAEATRAAETLVEQVVAGNLSGPTVSAKLAQLEARRAALTEQLAAAEAEPSVVTLLPSAANLYRTIVEEIREALGDEAQATAQGRDRIRDLIEEVRFMPRPGKGQYELEIIGQLEPLLVPATDGLVRVTNTRSRFGISHQSTRVSFAG